MEKKRTRGSLGLLIGTLLLVVVFVCNATALLITFRPQYYDVKVGDVAEEDIVSQMDAIDHAATDVLKQAARDAVEPVLKVNVERAQTQLAQLDTVLTHFDQFLVACRVIWDDNAVVLSQTQYRNDGDWRTLLPSTELHGLLSEYSLTEYLDAQNTYPILDAYLPMGQTRSPGEDPSTAAFKKQLMDDIEKQLLLGLSSDELTQAADTIRNNLPASIPIQVRMGLVPNLCAAFLVPTWTDDLPATEQARVEAAQKVNNVEIEKGDVLIAANSVVTEEQIATLTSLGMLQGERKDVGVYLGLVLYTLFIYIAMWLYLVFFERETLSSPRTMLSSSMILVISLGLCCAITAWEVRIAPILLVPLLFSSLHSRRTAMAMNVLNGLSIAVMMGADYGTLFNEQALLWAATSIVMGQAAIAFRERDRRRSGVLLSGLLSGVMGGFVSVAMNLIIGASFLDIFLSFGLVFVGALIATIIALGLTVLLEMLFDMPTDSRLNELLNTNHPLLKKMMGSAPGTYHHCMMVAQLAENAAESINANSLLAKVGASYHDVGKLRRPNMFSENQNSGLNPHDSLPPIESAKIIIAHQQDAEAVLQKFHLPAAVIRIVNEHHGNTLVAYFYAKAQKQMTLHKVSEKLFRYDAPRPSCVESAIVMMADSCEAAVRSLGSPSMEQVKEMTHKVIRGKMDDGQFDDCDITLGQIAKIEASFVNTFSGIMHDRISYSGAEDDRSI